MNVSISLTGQDEKIRGIEILRFCVHVPFLYVMFGIVHSEITWLFHRINHSMRSLNSVTQEEVMLYKFSG